MCVKRAAFCLFILLIGYSVYAASEKVEVLGVDILDECQGNRDIMGYEADCNDLFHYYPGDKNFAFENPRQTNEIRIASYNIYKLGVGETRYKDLNFTAKLVNQWDLIAAVEPQPAMGEDREDNENIATLLIDGTWDLSKAQKHYKKPAYLKLLDILRSFDPSWGMLVSPYGQGLNQELVVYYIRESLVHPVETTYCQQTKQSMLNREAQTGSGTLIYKAVRTHKKTNVERIVKTYRPSIFSEAPLYACTPTMGEKLDDLISRTPFYASFKATRDTNQQQAFNFTTAAVHARFRAPSANVIKHMLDTLFDPKGKQVPLFIGRVDGKLAPVTGLDILQKIWKAKKNKTGLKDLKLREKQDPEVMQKVYDLPFDVLESRIAALVGDEEIARYFETYHGLRLLQKVRESGQPNVIMMGDFNLEIGELPADKTAKVEKLKYWDFILKALPGANVYITEETSVGQNGYTQRDGLSSNYDHFILDTDTTKECRTKMGAINGRAFNFMLRESYKRNQDQAQLPPNERTLPLYEDIDKYLLWVENVFQASETDTIKKQIKKIKKDKSLSKKQKAEQIREALEPVNGPRREQLEKEYNRELYLPLLDQYRESLKPVYRVGKRGDLKSLDAKNGPKKEFKTCDGLIKSKGTIAQAWINDYLCRVFYSQMIWTEEYKVFAEVVSDHLPIEMSCRLPTKADHHLRNANKSQTKH